MKSFTNFNHEINKLIAFYKATLYSYEQAEISIKFKMENKIPYDFETTNGFKVLSPNYFKVKKNAKIEIRKNLNELIFVRLISALEVFLVDIIRDIFLETKEPFKRNDLRIELNHAELLSISSTAEISSKIINKECRKLTSAGYEDIVKFFKKHFDIDLNSFAPGKNKIEEYHDRRHLLVHRLGRTDIVFRKKYNYSKGAINIEEDYLNKCTEDLKGFSLLVNSQVEYYLKNEISSIVKKKKIIQRRVKLEIRSCKEKPNFFQDDFEFWVGDEFTMLKDILIKREIFNQTDFDLIVAGTFQEIKSYLSVIKRNSRKKEYQIIETTEFIQGPEKSDKKIDWLDAEILEKIRQKLPLQPWEKGIHKKIASELEIPTKIVSIAIQQLIARKIFKKQIDGIVIEDENVAEKPEGMNNIVEKK